MTFDITPLFFQILPNIIFLLAVLGIVLIILRHLPEAASHNPERQQAVEEKLLEKGLPTIAISRVRAWATWWWGKIFNFMLEAKDLKPSAAARYRIKKMFKGRLPQKPEPVPIIPPPKIQEPEISTEDQYLQLIKSDPKNLENFDALGRYYLDQSDYESSKDLYEYLVKVYPSNASYQAKLAVSYFRQKNFEEAARYYEKSLSLDPSQPNRYYNVGLCYEAVGKWAKSRKALEKAIALEPKNIKFYVTLSHVLLRMRERMEAKMVLRRAQKLDPANEEVVEKIRQIK